MQRSPLASVITYVLLAGVSGCDGSLGADASVPMDAGLREDGPLSCTRDLDCVDDLYCNGSERCAPSAPGSDARGCVPGAAPCDATLVCDESGDRCVEDTCDAGGDADGDGDPRPACGGLDCDDSEASIHSRATEVCDAAGIDEDCNPETYHGTEDGDADADGFVDARCFNIDESGEVRGGTDCDDADPNTNPDGLERCGGGDEDCDGHVDEAGASGELRFFVDSDADGFGDPDLSSSIVRCPEADGSPPAGYSPTDSDCADTVAAAYPGADAQPTPYCLVGRPCTTSAGAWVCTDSPLGCVRDSDVRWDYDCDGAVSPTPLGSCRYDVLSGRCVGRDGPTESSVDRCGENLPHIRGCMSTGSKRCGPSSMVTMPLECG